MVLNASVPGHCLSFTYQNPNPAREITRITHSQNTKRTYG